LGKKYIDKIINKINPDDLIKCISAFNGFAIYRTKKFLNCRYDGRFRLDYFSPKLILENIKAAGNMKFDQNKEDCEHRFFHFQAFFKNAARIRIAPVCLFK
jgi:hypothetical protein